MPSTVKGQKKTVVVERDESSGGSSWGEKLLTSISFGQGTSCWDGISNETNF